MRFISNDNTLPRLPFQPNGTFSFFLLLLLLLLLLPLLPFHFDLLLDCCFQPKILTGNYLDSVELFGILSHSCLTSSSIWNIPLSLRISFESDDYLETVEDSERFLTRICSRGISWISVGWSWIASGRFKGSLRDSLRFSFDYFIASISQSMAGLLGGTVSISDSLGTLSILFSVYQREGIVANSWDSVRIL